MRRLLRMVCYITLLLLVLCMGGCKKESYKNSDNGIPMPPSVKKISKDTIEISFPPYSYEVSGGKERWVLQKINSADNLEFSIIYNDKQIAKFPLGNVGAGTYEISGTVNIEKVEYKGVSITLNKDTSVASILLKKVAQ